MLVNVTGRGVVPCVNSLAPVRNVDLSEAQIRRILAFSFRVYDAASGLQINVKNIDSFIAKGAQKEEAVVPAAFEEAPVQKKRASKKKEAPKEEPVVETPVVEEAVTEETPVVEEAPAVVEEVVDIVETAEESSVDVSIAPDESDEDVSAETTVELPTYSKKKKKNRK